jgi:hypothetical protein
MSRRRSKAERRIARKVDAVLARAVESGQLRSGQVYEIVVRHQPKCALLNGGDLCDCDPDVSAPERLPHPEEN